VVFEQFRESVRAAGRRFSSRGLSDDDKNALAEGLEFFSYTPKAGEDLVGIAARCVDIPYWCIASLNRIAHREDFEPKKALLLPTVRGVFVSADPRSGLERLLAAAREGAGGLRVTVTRERGPEDMRFFPGEDFSPAELAFFFDRGFQFPLRERRVTDSFGPRINPVTGKQGNHRGVDLAAPLGTPVYAARAGAVSEAGENAVYGKYVVLKHANGYRSLYGHLSRVDVKRGAEVPSGGVIGRVGSTGQSTGPHLHFELSKDGRLEDPERLLK
jgi:murein DD-endopeptidase MepM/ murein hydrolase activator NlpD